MKIEIKRGTFPRHSVNRYIQEVYVDGTLLGYFQPDWLSNEYTLTDKGGWRIKRKEYNHFSNYFQVTKIADMGQAVRDAFEEGEVPTDQDIVDREAKIIADKAQEKVDQIERDRVWQIKLHAEELFDVLSTIVLHADVHNDGFFNSAAGIAGVTSGGDVVLKGSFIEDLGRAQTAIRKATEVTA